MLFSCSLFLFWPLELGDETRCWIPVFSSCQGLVYCFFLLTNFANVAPKSCLAITPPPNPKYKTIISIINFARILAIDLGFIALWMREGSESSPEALSPILSSFSYECKQINSSHMFSYHASPELPLEKINVIISHQILTMMLPSLLALIIL